MKDNQSDGSYILEFSRDNGKKEHIVAGYYTNGAFPNKWIKFKIESDTTIVSYSKF